MKSMESSFWNDLKGERVVAEYLDRFLYANLNIYEFERYTNHEKQNIGIDVYFKFNDLEYKVDEKSTLHYPRGLSTFSFELAYKKDGEWKEGWFYHENKATDYYLLAWPLREDVRLSQLTISHLYYIEVMLINRHQLQTYLYTSFDLDKTRIYREVENIKHEQRYGKLHNIHPLSKSYYFYTERLAETPINIVVQKDTLKKFADFHFRVDVNKVYPIPVKNYNEWLIK
jgi:hypothetical protein